MYGMYDFKGTEQKILDFWEQNDVFERSLESRKKGKKFVFFEGPPTANGLPHIGHFLTRIYKDLYGRYKTMRGFYVLRKAGWDTHGLPVEIEIEKELGIKNKKDIENYGIAKFNKKAKESVWKYKSEWEAMSRRMGFWIDLKDPYITYKNSYIETLWNIIKAIWDKKLLYLAHKVVPFCARCGTSLSSHEVAQGYKKVKDKSVYLKFKLKSEQKAGDYKLNKNTYVLAWTTTPWTLPGNVALAVGSSIKYQVVGVKDKNENYILAEELAPKVFLDAKYEILNTISGTDLVGLEYEPLFDIKELKSDKSYKIYAADFVSTEDGTGIVHTAVMYGEDDYELGKKEGLPRIHTVDEQGKFIHVGPVRSLARDKVASPKDLGEATSYGIDGDLNGRYVKSKETEDIIIKYLKNRNLLLKEEEYEHEYPFCWRCDSPLLYYAKSSWFIKMSDVREDLLNNNSKINWVPEHIKEGRFGQWLKEGKDWAFSRERYWGTPLPIWKCQKCDSYKVVSSVAEIEKNSFTEAKKNNYYIMRHGYSSRDERGKMLVSSVLEADKYHLTEESRKKIQKTAESIKNNYHIDLIYSSPFIRTMETAEIVAKTLHLNINKSDLIREIGHGGCEGMSHKDCPNKDLIQDINSRHHELGESWNDVRLRMAGFINEIESKYSGKNILIVSHGDPLWLLNSIAKGATAEEIVKDSRNGGYPGIGEFMPVKWKSIPRNEYGELDLHRPFIDDVVLKCSDCGAAMKKIPDLADVWFDSGCMPYAQWHWPFENKKIFESQFPADFIVEGIDQTRGWFYTLLAVSTLLGKGNPYKNVISLGHVLDESGKKMSKSKGNVVSPSQLMDKVGADAGRWYFYTINSPGEYKLFSMKDIESKLKGFIFTLQNCIRFYELYNQETLNKDGAANLLDKWIISKTNKLIVEVSSLLDSYDMTTAARIIEKFVVEDLSNWWLRRSRKRKEALGLLRLLLIEISKIIAPFVPFVAEDIYQRMHKGVAPEKPSIHLEDWPRANKKLINKKLEDEMDEIRNIVTSGLALRKEKEIKVRQPLRAITIKRSSKFPKDLEELLQDELNVKQISYDSKQENNLVLDSKLDRALIYEGYARELMRQIQDMRKEAKYKLDEKVFSRWHADDEEVSSAIHEWTDEIKKETLLKEFIAGPADQKTYDIEKEFDLAPNKKIWLGIRR